MSRRAGMLFGASKRALAKPPADVPVLSSYKHVSRGRLGEILWSAAEDHKMAIAQEIAARFKSPAVDSESLFHSIVAADSERWIEASLSYRVEPVGESPEWFVTVIRGISEALYADGVIARVLKDFEAGLRSIIIFPYDAALIAARQWAGTDAWAKAALQVASVNDTDLSFSAWSEAASRINDDVAVKLGMTISGLIEKFTLPLSRSLLGADIAIRKSELRHACEVVVRELMTNENVKVADTLRDALREFL
jgi:hypothetical protein